MSMGKWGRWENCSTKPQPSPYWDFNHGFAYVTIIAIGLGVLSVAVGSFVALRLERRRTC